MSSPQAKAAAPTSPKSPRSPKAAHHTRDVISDGSKKSEALFKKLKDLVAAVKKRQEAMTAQRKAEQEVRVVSVGCSSSKNGSKMRKFPLTINVFVLSE